MTLKIDNLIKDFDLPKGKKFRALDGITLTINEGEFCTFLGPSGCGKTTLLRVIAGFETLTNGSLTYNGQDLTPVPANKRNFSMVFQSYALFPHMTVRENIAYGLKLKKMPSADIKTKVNEIIKLTGLEQAEDKHPSQMSGGQQQRVALARALVMEPKIILFDEPLSNLDAKLRVFMREEIRSLQKRLGLTAIYVTHDQEEAMAISDRVVVINQGKIEQNDRADVIYHRPRNEFVANFIGSANLLKIFKKDANKIEIFGKEYNIKVKDLESRSRLVLRPESIHLAAQNKRHKAVVINSTYLGSIRKYKLECENQILLAQKDVGFNEPVFKVGESVTFDLDEGSFHFI